ncbi:hypothetical protein PYCC9005_005019 [Savitreella phatthalungensis]
MRPVEHCIYGIVLGLVALGTYLTHFSLPEPVTTLQDGNGNPHFSEKQALAYVSTLADSYGYRVVGAREHVASRDWLKQEIARLKSANDADPWRRDLYEIEVLNQKGTGSHRFDMMGKVVMKQYADIENVVVRISSKRNPSSKQNAVLVNAHLDSTLPSPGAADDALGIAIQLELIRIITSRKPKNGTDPLMDNSLILLFNDAEESLQDASHLFANEPHPWASTVRGVVNLEAAGNTGSAVLFQATSNKFLDAYGATPHPYGSVVASDVFSTGLILSDTDFRQFEQYAGLTGLDMAVVGNSYAYHTRLDSTDRIERGSAQHFGDNTLAIVEYLTQPGMDITVGIEKSQDRIFFSVAQKYFANYSKRTAQLIARAVFTLVLGYVGWAGPSWRRLAGAIGCINVAFWSGLIVNNAVAALLTLTGLQMRWFTHEMSCLFLYIPTAMLGWTLPHLYFRPDRKHMHLALLLHYATLSLLPVGSSFILFYTALGVLLGTLADSALLQLILVSVPGMFLGSEAHWSVLEIFVPLTGRLGVDAPAENIMSTIVGLVSFGALAGYPLWVLTLSRPAQNRLMVLLAAFALTSLAVLSQRPVWDADHPRRLFVQHMYNLTDGATSIHFAAADSAPGFEAYVDGITNTFDLGKPTRWIASDDAPEWDTLYPFSQFLQSWKVDAATAKIQPAIELPNVVGRVISRDRTANTATIELTTHHPGLLWTVIAFDADVVAWSLSELPEPGLRRQHIRQAAAFGTDIHTMQLTFKLHQPQQSHLIVDFVGVEELAMHPAKVTDQEALERPSMKFFAHLDTPAVIGDAVDLCSNGVLAGRFPIPL